MGARRAAVTAGPTPRRTAEARRPRVSYSAAVMSPTGMQLTSEIPRSHSVAPSRFAFSDTICQAQW